MALPIVAIVAIDSPSAATRLTEADVVERARADPDVAIAAGHVALGHAREVADGLYANPTLSWQREAFLGTDADQAEDAVALSLPLALSGRRAARVSLARSATETDRAAVALRRSDAVVRALSSFYRGLGVDQRLRIAKRTLRRLDRAATTLTQRQRAGTASGYEANRLAIAAEMTRSALRQAEGRARSARTRLAILLGVDPAGLVLEGTLRIVSDPAVPAAPAATRRPSLSRARAAVRVSKDAIRQARTAWIPTLNLSGGLRMQTQAVAETAYGYVAGVSVALPFFSAGQAIRQQARARHQLAVARLRSVERGIALATSTQRIAFAAARGELARFEQATANRVERMVHAAEAGYREGNRTIVELIDAERARAEVDYRRVELALAAKLAQLRLRAAAGAFE